MMVGRETSIQTKKNNYWMRLTDSWIKGSSALVEWLEYLTPVQEGPG